MENTGVTVRIRIATRSVSEEACPDASKLVPSVAADTTEIRQCGNNKLPQNATNNLRVYFRGEVTAGMSFMEIIVVTVRITIE